MSHDDQGTEKWSSDGDPVAPSGEAAAGTVGLAGDGVPYDLDGVVGRGGVGVVLKARDRRLGRVVAIKMVPTKSAAIQARFEREALLTARLQHPGIVPVYEVGRWPNGESYYAMRLIAGQPLSDLIAAAGRFDDRLALVPKVIAVVEAVAYAHTERVIHRDLKPRNVVIGPHGETMVIDWGLAKDLTQPDVDDPAAPARSGDETVDGAVMGTPAYMPPEQANGEPVDERADVYALGAMLYNVLAGAPPFSGTTSADVLRQVKRGDVPDLGARQPGVPRELAAIVGKAMARAPADRYANAGELAGDLRRFVTGQLVGAHRYSRPVLIARAIRRHPVLAVLAVAAVVLVVLGGLALRRISAQQAETEARRRELLLGQARATVETDPTSAVALLAHYPRAAPAAELARVRAIALDAESRGVARHVLAGHTDRVRDVAISPDGASVASVGGDGALYLWTLATGAKQRIYQTTQMDAVGFDPRGRYLAASLGPARGMVAYDLARQTTRTFSTPDDIYAATFSPDGAHLVAGSSGGRIWSWELATGAVRELVGHEAWVSNVVFTADGRTLLSTSEDGTARVWDFATGVARAVTLSDQGYRIMPSRDGSRFAVGCVDGNVTVYTTADPTAPPIALRGDAGAVDNVEFSPDGTQLAFAGMGQAVYVADLATRSIRALHGHTDDVTGMAFLADGTLITAGADGTVRQWDLTTGLAAVWRGHTDEIVAMAIGADERTVATSSADRTVRLWAVPRAPRAFAARASRESEFRAPPGRDRLYFSQEGGIATMLDLTTGVVRAISTARPWVRIAGNPTGTQLAYRDGQRRVSLVDLVTGVEHPLPPEAPLVAKMMSYTADGAALVIPGWDGLAVVDPARLTVRQLPYASGRLGDDDPKVTALILSRDGARAVTVGKDLERWELGAGTSALVEPPPLPWPPTIAGSPDLAALAAGAVGGLAYHDAAGWRRLLTTAGEVFPIGFAPDGSTLVAADDGGTIHVWRLGPGGPTGPTELVGHSGPVRSLDVSPDGRRMVSGGADGAVRAWDLTTGQELAAFRAPGGRAIEWVGLRGDDLIAAGRDGTVRVWPWPTRAAGPVEALLDGLTSYRQP